MVFFSSLPEPIKRLLRPIRERFRGKYGSELAYWRRRHAVDNGRFHNDHYRRYMLAMAGEETDEFIRGKIVADFGCGPRGSLVWATAAAERIGIDVLAKRYARAFPDDIASHNMRYVASTEKSIPLPNDSVDVMFTLNAIDHTFNFDLMCSEIIRVIKPGGLFIGSFNLEEPPTSCEPQQLNEEIIQRQLLSKLEIESYRITRKGPRDDQYAHFFSGDLAYIKGEEGFLWVRARK